jgi:tRNA A37 threonylcarbamoyladenosine biosynthesis protein TsaE
MLKKKIMLGDFKVYLDEKGYVVVEWPNTAIFAPGPQEFAYTLEVELTEAERGVLGKEMSISTGIKSLSVRALVPRGKSKPQEFTS